MSSGVRWLFMSCFLFGGGAGLWDGGRSILQGKKRLLSRKQEKRFCCFDVPEGLIVFVTEVPIQSQRLSSGSPPVPFVSPQLELLMEINSLLAFCAYSRQIPTPGCRSRGCSWDPCLGTAPHHPAGGGLCCGWEVPERDNEAVPAPAWQFIWDGSPASGFPGGI